MYATGKPFKAEDAMGWQTMEEVNKSWEKDGKLIGKRGENGHPHMGKPESMKPLDIFIVPLDVNLYADQYSK